MKGTTGVRDYVDPLTVPSSRQDGVCCTTFLTCYADRSPSIALCVEDDDGVARVGLTPDEAVMFAVHVLRLAAQNRAVLYRARLVQILTETDEAVANGDLTTFDHEDLRRFLDQHPIAAAGTRSPE